MTFPFTLQSPPEHRGLIPDRVDVAVIGGGIIGVMSAWELAKSGRRGVGLDTGRGAGGHGGVQRTERARAQARTRRNGETGRT